MTDNSWVIGDNEFVLYEEGKDILKTSKYVEQLFDIITNLSDTELKQGFNIGLYGGWGSGKSSIVKTLEDKIEKECNNEFVVIDFDCWKYSNDDLRRGILLDLDGDNEELKESLYYNISNSSANTLIDKKKWRKYIIWSIFISIILGFLPEILNFILNFINSNIGQLNFGFSGTFSYGIFSFSFVLSIFSFIGNEIISNLKKEFTVNHTITKSKNPMYSSEEFEKKFGEILSKKYEGKKILFIFDNIDRCESDTVKEVLMTIKTFLNKDNCIFILPIDYENICKSYKNYDQGKEYLRKIFNLGIQLEKPKYDDLWNLVEQTILQNGWKEFFSITENEISEIAYILSLVFSDNPRKIKQFLNNLGAEYLLYSGEKPENAINMCLLTKKLIIQQEIPELYDILLKNKRNYEEFMKKLESYAGKYKEYYEDYSKYSDEKKWDDYIIFVIFKQLKKLDERKIQIISHLSEIRGDFLNIGDYKKVLSDLVDNQQYEDFKNKIKKDNLENQAKLLFEEYSKQIGKSKFNDKKYIIGFIYFYIFSSQDNKLLGKVFTRTKRPYFEYILTDLNIEDNIFFRFVELLKVEDIKRMGKGWISELFTRRILNEKNLNNVKKYKNEENKLELLIDPTLISQYVNLEIKNENIENSTIYKFLENNEKFIPDRLLSEGDISNRIDNCPIDIINKIKILSLGNKVREFSERIKILLDNSQWYTVQSNTNYIKNYVLLASAFLKNNIIDDNIKNILINIYATYDIRKEKIIKIFYDYIYSKKANEWESFSDAILDQRMKNVIECMIMRTNEENGLSTAQLNRIYREYPWDIEENRGVVIALWNNKKGKDVIINNMKNETLNTIKSKIEFINGYKKILIKDKEIFGHIIYEKIKNILGRKDKSSIEELSKFLNENIEFKDYILKQNKKEIINILNDYRFSPDDKEGPYYEKKIKEIINILEKTNN